MASPPKERDPVAAATELQLRVRRLTKLLRSGEPYHIEIDAIASELGILAMQLQGWQPADFRTFRPKAATSVKTAPARRVVDFRSR